MGWWLEVIFKEKSNKKEEGKSDCLYDVFLSFFN